MNSAATLTALEELPLTAWQEPFDAAVRARAAEVLESGGVLVLPNLPFVVPADERALLDPSILGCRRKNISYDPAAGRIGNAALDPAGTARLATMMQRFATKAQDLVSGLFPHYAADLEVARTSFRPAEISGRAYSPRHDDRRLHVDAFPTRPMHGRRILRLFSNVAPDGAPRGWVVGETFPGFAGTFLPRVKPPLPGSAALHALLGLTKGRRSAYDHIMLALHDAVKMDKAYQSTGPQRSVAFAAGCTWLCFTDQVLHAAVSGHCAFEQTFHLPVAAMQHPAGSPLRILESATGRSLV